MDVLDVVDEIPDGHGSIGLLSANEFLPGAREFDLALCAASGPRIAVILAAGPQEADRSGELALEHYRGLGADPTIVDVLRREQAGAEALPEYDLLFLGGGSPPDLLACLHGTPLWDEVLARWARGAAIGGSSAGAMALCTHCLTPLPGANAPTVWCEGLGPLERFALAVHAASRPREWLEEVSSTAPVPVIALDDEAGMILRPGDPPRIVGGAAWVASGVA